MPFKQLKDGTITWSSYDNKSKYRIEAKTRNAWNTSKTYWLLTRKEGSKWIVVGLFTSEELAKKGAIDHHNAATAAESN